MIPEIFEKQPIINMANPNILNWSVEITEPETPMADVAWPKVRSTVCAECLLTSAVDDEWGEFFISMRTLLIGRYTDFQNDAENRLRHMVYEYKYQTTDIFNRTGVWGEHDT